MLVRRILVPDDAVPAPSAGARELGRGGAATNARLFAEALLEKSRTRPPRRLPKVIVSLGVHGLLLVALVLIPLYFTEAIDIHQFNETLLVAPPAAPPPPPPAAAAVARPAATLKKVLPVPGKLMAPTVVPKQVREVSDASGAPELMASVSGGTGVPGGVPGGQPGGVLGGILGGTGTSLPSAPEVAAPKAPIRVGGAVKAPRLLSRVEPVYPVLARQAKLEGSVVIDAVIDEHGNVVSMRVLSGSPLLIQAAMDALRHWRYEPTSVNGQSVPVELTVTITFRLS